MQKILVIEDEPSVRENILELLEAESFEAIGAENGLAGVQLAQEQIPDLIICDLRMPEMDGTEVLTTLRQNPATAMIPFIFLTASADKSNLRRAMDLGADDYLTKPCTTTELMQAIAARLTKQIVVTQLQQKVHELERISTLKDDFLSEASHDLRAPLANMKISIQLLKMATTEEQRNRYLELLEAECDRETALLNDLLDLQRLEANAYPLVPQPLSLQTWIPYIVESFKARIQEKQLILTINVDPQLPPLISDPTSLGRVFNELLNNACKYTPQSGKIILSVRHISSEAVLTGFVSKFVLSISNQGEISADDLPHIFDKFYRALTSDVTKQTGTGLGLALVRRLVEQMKGTIDVKSSTGWTTFTIQLPTKLIN